MTTIAPHEIYVGRDYGSHDITITPDMVQHYADATGDRNPWYFGPSPFGGPVAPALIRHSEVYTFGPWYLKNIFGNLHAKQEWELFHPIMVGDRITARSLIVERYLKRGREYVVNEVSYFATDGRLLMRGRTHQSFLLDQSPQGTVVDKEREKAPARRFEIGTGDITEELPSLTKTVTVEMSQKFSGPAKNYHTDREEARKMGFPDIVVQGMMSVCFLSEMLTNRFGEGWYYGGRMAVNLVNVLWPNEELACRGVIKELTPEGAHQRAHLEVWCQKPDATKTVVGTASAVLL
ncbi:MAG: MaoC family dehydratase [Chloroflexota bacterium]|nr:MaoC family dehydratase [Chloroflexota bacterium]